MGRLLGAGALVAASIVGGFFTGKGASEAVLFSGVVGLVLLLLVLAVAVSFRFGEMKRVTLCLLWIVPTAFAGGYLAGGYGEDEPAHAWLERHLRVVRRQLGGLRDALHAHRAAHRRYSTNDEGLASLDKLGARFPISLWGMGQGAPGDIPTLGGWRGEGIWDWEGGMLRMHRVLHGRPPRSAEELREFYRLQAPPAGLPPVEEPYWAYHIYMPAIGTP